MEQEKRAELETQEEEKVVEFAVETLEDVSGGRAGLSGRGKRRFRLVDEKPRGSDDGSGGATGSW